MEILARFATATQGLSTLENSWHSHLTIHSMDCMETLVFILVFFKKKPIVFKGFPLVPLATVDVAADDKKLSQIRSVGLWDSDN